MEKKTKKNLLDVAGLEVSFHSDGKWFKAVDKVSLHIDRGETLGIVGESGSGKSVTALSVMGLLPSPAARIDAGEVTFTSENSEITSLLRLTEHQWQKFRGKQISMIFQEPMTSLNPVMRCGKQVMEVLTLHEKLSPKEAADRTLHLFEEVRLPRIREMFTAWPHQLSGGQKQRVMIAMAMACHPSLLIADEPTTALDVTVQKTILELLAELQQKHGIGILFISHDLAVVRTIAHRIVVMNQGKIVESGETEALFTHPRHPYTKGLLACRPPLDVRLNRLPTVSGFLEQEKNQGDQSLFAVQSEEERKKHLDTIYRQPVFLSLDKVTVDFPTRKNWLGKTLKVLKAVDQVSLDVYSGETLGLVGESGCGKTTLGRAVLALITTSSGTVKLDGHDLTTTHRSLLRKLRKNFQIIFQDPYSSLNPRLTVGSCLTEPMKVHGILSGSKQRKERAMQLLRKVGLEESHFYRYPHEFSGGQRQRICIARALALQPKFIVCDESVSALDISVQAQVLNLLNDLKKEFGFTYIFISHDLSVVKFMSDRMVVMKDGKIVESGDADQVYHHPVNEYTRQLIEAIPQTN
ncbi:MAG: ABC transporter ATP-binding protein [Bacteroidetes bacterium]|nr:ABC transporter ATP-binding protein [Bacteroidota bacterium]